MISSLEGDRSRPAAGGRPAPRRSAPTTVTVLAAVATMVGTVLTGACAAPRAKDGDGTLAERIAQASEARRRGPADPAASAPVPGDTAAPPATSTPSPPADDGELAPVEATSPSAADAPEPADARPGPRGRTTLPDPATLQAGVIALGDEIIDLVVVATDTIEDGTEDVDRRRRAHEIKLAVGRSVVNTVAGPSSFAALVDLVVKSSLLARAAESSARERFGEQASILIDAFEEARDDAWRAAGRLMPESELVDLQAAVEDLPLPEPDLIYVTQVSLREYVAAYERQATAERGGAFSILSLLRIDPLANLDPATRELEQSRLLGERALYQAQRTGRLLRWELEGLLYDLLAAPETQNLLRSADRASRSSETLASTVEALPQTVAEERAAAIADLDALLARQRSALIEDTAAAVARERAAAIDDLQAAVATEREALREDVAAVEGPLVRTMESTRATIEHATRMSASLDETLGTFDTVLQRMGVDRTQPREPRDGGDPERAPFDIAAYGAVASDIGAAASNVTRTLEAFESVLNEPLLRPAASPDEAAGAGTSSDEARRRPQVPAAVALEETGRALLDALLIRAAVLVIVAGLTAIGAAWAIQRIRRGGS